MLFVIFAIIDKTVKDEDYLYNHEVELLNLKVSGFYYITMIAFVNYVPQNLSGNLKVWVYVSKPFRSAKLR